VVAREDAAVLAWLEENKIPNENPMTLSRGSRLGPYEVIGPLGAGGMGEVWRARDARLGREVAIKVLPADLSADPGRLRRFEKEARSASALNHPNIVTVYEIGSAESVYIAMELVEGKTLREIVAEGPLSTRKLLQVAAEVAEGLAKAHAAGIVHRDLKPENLMVTGDGHAKILDFGLAKLIEPEAAPGEETRAPTVSAGTEPGVVMGTVAYMSPEQASGKPLDFRSDQFSLGSVLYEMATGKPPFSGKTKPETLAAIIREEPESIAALNPKLPAPLRWIIERCLSKEPKERYAATEDLSRDLANVRDHLSEASLPAEALALLPPTRRLWLFAGGALLAAALLGLLAGKAVWRAPSSSPSFQRLTFRRGLLSNARFAPDGRTIVYSATWEGSEGKVYLTQVGSTESRQLLENADLFDVSPSGELAVMLSAEGQGMLARMPLTGGAPRSVVADIAWGNAAWAPDGKDLAVVRTVQGRNRLEYPIGKVLYETTGLIGLPRFSPGGDKIAFFGGGRGSSIIVLDISSKETKTLSTGWSEIRGGMPAWTPDGKEIWFTAAEPGQVEALWAAGLSGKRRLVMRVAGLLELFDISKDRRVLLGHHTLLPGLMCLPPGEANERDLSWLSESRLADLSSDGKTVVISEGQDAGGPTGSVYLRKTDGSPAIRLGEGVGAGLSPDGSWVIALVPPVGEKSARLTLLPTGAGESRTLLADGFEVFVRAAWLPDGKAIVFSGNEPGHAPRVYLLEVATGRFRAITPEGVGVREIGAFLSPDGKFILAVKDRETVLWPVSGDGPISIRGLSPDDVPIQVSADGESLYVARFGEAVRRVWLLELRTGKRRLWKELRGADPPTRLTSLFVTPNGASYAYGTYRPISTCYVVEGLR